MTDPCAGSWKNVLCIGLPDIEEMLTGARLDISEAHHVTWTFVAGLGAGSTATLVDGKLRGEFASNDVLYYYEIDATTLPDYLTTRPFIYGIVCKIDRSVGELGDPVAWKAEAAGSSPAATG